MRLTGLAWLAVFASAPLRAQDADPHETLVEQLTTRETFDIAYRRLMDVDLPAAFLADPDIAALEKECPGAVQALLTAASPLFLRINRESESEYREMLREFLATRMSDADAQAAARFFASDVGQRFLRTVGAESTLGNSLHGAMADDEGAIDRASFERDRRTSAATTVAALSDADRRAFADTLNTSWGKAFSSMASELADLRFHLLSRDLTPEQGAELDSLANRVLLQHFTACDE